MVSRRAFLRLVGGSLAAPVAVGAYAWRIEPHWLEIVRRPLVVPRLPGALAGKTLLQLSDIHLGQVDASYIVDTFRRAALHSPDIVVLTGDLIGFRPGVFDQFATVYRHLPRGRLATIATLGNHDYGAHWRQTDVANRVVREAEAFATVLRNELHEVEGLQFLGFDDLWAKQFDPAPVLAKLDPARAAIALTHNPDTVDFPVWDRFDGWILSGHTHGGQCKPPFLPPPLLPVKNRRYTAGEFELTGDRRMYINRGVGHTLPVRFNVRPEITVFELQPA